MSLTTTTYVLGATPTRIDFGIAQAILVENLGQDSVWYGGSGFPGVSGAQNQGSLNLGDVKQYFTTPMYFAASRSSATIQVTFIPADTAIDPSAVVAGIPTDPLSWVSVKNPTYGAKGDGATDDTAAAQAAINACSAAGGGVVWFPIGTYRVAAGLTGASKVSLLGAGRKASILQFDDVAQVGINCVGTSAASTTLSADTTEWTQTVTVTSASGMAIGQHFHIYESGNYGPSFFTRITNISGTTITVEEPIPCIFVAANSPVVKAYNDSNLIQGVDIMGLGFKNAAATPTLRQYFVFFQHFLDCSVEKCSFNGLGASSASGVYMTSGRNGSIQRSLFDSIVNGGSALAAVMDGVTASDLSHNHYRNVSSAGIITRSPWSVMIGNRSILNSSGGRANKILAGSNYTTAVGNVASNVTGSGFNAVHMSDCWGCTIVGNSVSNVNNNGINITGFIATRTQDNVTVGNAMRQIGVNSVASSTVNGPNYFAANDTSAAAGAYNKTADVSAPWQGGVLDLGSQALPYTVASTTDITTTKVVKVAASSTGTLTVQGFGTTKTMAGELLTFDITNSSAGTVTMAWSSSYHQSYTAPAAGKRNQVTFRFDGTNWIQAFAQGPDVSP